MAPSPSSSTEPKYPYPSEINVGDFVPINLSPTNYFMWKPLMLNLIESQALVGFINGTITAPPEKVTPGSNDSSSSFNGGATKEIDNPDYQAWKRSDELLCRWISSTLSEDDLVAVLMLTKTAKQLWTIIEKRFTQAFKYLTEDELSKEAGKNLSHYLPLHKAALAGDWDSAAEFLKQEPDAFRAIITGFSETALVVAVRSTKRNHFVKKLVKLMSPADLAVVDRLGLTALHIAAAVGNLEVVMLLVNKNPDLPNVRDNNKTLPLHLASGNGQRKVASYLLTVTKEDVEPKPFEGESGVQILHALIFSGFYDIALSLLQRYPKLAWEEPSPLLAMSVNRSAFLSGIRFSFWQRLIYSCVPADHDNGGGAHNSANVRQKVHAILWKIAKILVPQVKNVEEKKSIHHQVLQLVKCICLETAKLSNLKATSLFGLPFQMSVCLGIHEIIEEILASFPGAIFFTNFKGQTLFHDAIVCRRANVFNLIYQFGAAGRIILGSPDMSRNLGLHLAGYFGPQQHVELKASAINSALQVQRELQWFKEVEKLTLPRDREQINAEGKTPAMIFTETHTDLIKEGEQRMKDTANSSTFVAALVVTVAFAAAITVPGGNNGDTGRPYFTIETAFIIFAITDAIALFSSTSSLLMFLSILTSRYAEDDFLYALPKKLIIGLITLFFSILSTMIAFSVTLYIVFGDNQAWVLISVVALACLLVILFAFLQFSLLFDMIQSTYFPGIFGKQSDRSLY